MILIMKVGMMILVAETLVNDGSDEDKSNEGVDSNDGGGGDAGKNGGYVGDNDDGDDEVNGINKDVGFDNVNAGDGKSKVDLIDVYFFFPLVLNFLS